MFLSQGGQVTNSKRLAARSRWVEAYLARNPRVAAFLDRLWWPLIAVSVFTILWIIFHIPHLIGYLLFKERLNALLQKFWALLGF